MGAAAILQAAKNSPPRDSAKGVSATEPSDYTTPVHPPPRSSIPFLPSPPSPTIPPRATLEPLAHVYTRISLGRSYSHGTSYDPVLRAKCGRTLDTNARLKIHSYLRTLWQPGSAVRREKEAGGASLFAHDSSVAAARNFFGGNETSTRRLTQLIEKTNRVRENVYLLAFVLYER